MGKTMEFQKPGNSSVPGPEVVEKQRVSFQTLLRVFNEICICTTCITV